MICLFVHFVISDEQNEMCELIQFAFSQQNEMNKPKCINADVEQDRQGFELLYNKYSNDALNAARKWLPAVQNMITSKSGIKVCETISKYINADKESHFVNFVNKIQHAYETSSDFNITSNDLLLVVAEVYDVFFRMGYIEKILFVWRSGIVDNIIHFVANGNLIGKLDYILDNFFVKFIVFIKKTCNPSGWREVA